MNDLISRDALREDMRIFKNSVIFNKNPAQRRLPNWNDAVSLVGSAPVVNRWISVEDRLPNKGQNVISCIVSIDGSWKHVGCDIYFGDGKFAMIMPNEHEEMKVTHWMPLPEPPVDG